MQKEILQFEARKTRIYKDIYRPSSNLSRFFGTLLSILLQGQSQVGTTHIRLHKRKGY